MSHEAARWVPPGRRRMTSLTQARYVWCGNRDPHEPHEWRRTLLRFALWRLERKSA